MTCWIGNSKMVHNVGTLSTNSNLVPKICIIDSPPNQSKIF